MELPGAAQRVLDPAGVRPYLDPRPGGEAPGPGAALHLPAGKAHEQTIRGRVATMTTLREGFQIEEPSVFVPWDVTEQQLRELLEPHGLRKVTFGYFTLSCRSLGGLSHELGFHFIPRNSDHLTELEFFRAKPTVELHHSFDEFQHHLELTFGPPTRSVPGQAGFTEHRWQLPGATIVHYVVDRFGPEEHVRIIRREDVLA